MSFDLGAVLGHLKLDRADWDAAVKAAVKDMDGFTKKVNQSGQTMRVLKDGARVFAGIGLAIGAAGVAALKTSAHFEQYDASFTTMLGSAEKAQAFLKEIQEFAAVTPFSMDDLAQASQTLLSFGISSEKTIESIKMLGDVSQGNAERFRGMSLAFAQIQSTGRLMGQDLLQLINQGFNPLTIISQKTGKSMAVLKDEMSKGAISAEMVTEAFKIATSEGGRFFGAMEKQSQTLNGLLSTMGDSAQMLAKDFGDAILPAAKEGVKAVIDFLNELRNEKEMFESIGGAIKSIMGVVLEVLPTMLDLVDALAPIVSTVMDLAVTLIKALKPAFDQIVRIINILAPIIDKLFKAISPLIEIIANVLADVLQIVADLLEDISPILDMLLSILGPIFEMLKPICALLMDVLKPVLELLLTPLRELGKAIKALGADIDDAFFHFLNLSKANAESIKNLEEEKKAFENLETAIKSGTAKKADLLKMEADLKAKYPELRENLDLVNKSYAENAAAIDAVIKQRKYDQIQMLENTKLELAENIKRVKSFEQIFDVLGVVMDPTGMMRKNLDTAISNMEQALPKVDDQIKIAKQEFEDFGKAAVDAAGGVAAIIPAQAKVNEELLKFEQEFKDKLFEITATEEQKIAKEEQTALARARKLGADTTNVTAYYSQKRIEIYKKEYAEILSQRDEELKGILAYVKEMTETETEKLDEEYKKRSLILAGAIAEQKKTLDKSLEIIDGNSDVELKAYNDLLEAKKKLDAKYNKDREKANKEAGEKWVDEFKKLLGKVQEISNVIGGSIEEIINQAGNLFGMSLDNQLVELQNTYGRIEEEMSARFEAENETAQNTYDAEVAALKDKYRQHLISTAEYNDSLATLDENFKTAEQARTEAQAAEEQRVAEEQAAAEKELRRQAFESEKAADILSVWMDLATGIMGVWASCWSLGPIAGPIVAGIMTGVMTGFAIAETAAIASKTFPEYAAGGVGQGFAVVGEEGPELIHLGTPSRIYPANETARMMNGAGIQVNIGTVQSDVDLMRVMGLSALRYEAMLKGSRG